MRDIRQSQHCDLNLGAGKSGFEVARETRQDSVLAEVPLVAITGYATEADHAAAIEAGFNMVFQKPFRYADITQALHTLTGI